MITLFLNELIKRLKVTHPHKELIKQFVAGKFPINIGNIRGTVLSTVVCDLKNYTKGNIVVVLPTEREASIFFQDLSFLDSDVLKFTSWETLPYSGDSPSSSVYGRRISALGKLLAKGKQGKKIIVTSLKGFLSYLPPRDFLQNYIIRITKNREIDVESLEKKLQEGGYLRVPRVSVHGEFALRGEVLDIFMHGMDEALRVVFSFDEVEEIKFFDPITQSSTGKVDEIDIFPCREIIWSDSVIEKTALLSILTEEKLESLKEFRTVKGEEYLFPFAFSDRQMITDYAGENCTVVFVDREILENSCKSIEKEYTELYRRAGGVRKNPLPPEVLIPDFDAAVMNKPRQIFLPVLGNTDNRELIRYNYEAGRSFFGNFQYLKDEFSRLIDSGYKIYLFSSSDSQRVRIENILRDFDITVISGSISSGFVLPDLKIMAIHENEIFGRKKRIPSSVKKTTSQVIDSFVDLNPGDFVVHINYGIGKFLGIDRIKAANTERDYIQLEYADEEAIFIPIEQVNLVQRYIGSEGSSPRLDRLGGKSWETRKNKVKKAAEDIAGKLLKLYSKRKKAQGFSFPADTDWQMEFEATFPYEETEDQLKCIEDVKNDMESTRPMDRLICGDVGYGKTEIAMRAAFKASSSGRQVIFLAPTTILAEQHYDNFRERFSNFPINIRMMSRFVSRKEQAEVLKGLEDGSVDIVIGTHRLIQKDVILKNPGLMIIDEEQRFGVKDKERMKELKNSIDSLALSATPIPRTLHMSLLKIRDMSILKTPPYNRRPIETFVREYNEEIVVKAIRREVERGGQVFYLHNRIESLDNIKLFLQKLMPELMIETAHGRMSSSEIEETMKRFIHHGAHVLVSTTIIENGIDIPNVNTIIIDRADMYGISQLYQLRGRVGRSDRVAFAYLLYPENRALSELALKRLQIISDNTELGSGFKIAMKDLEVRGAGNLLGKQQSGEIASVGFDMYLRLLDEAIRELDRDGREEEAPEVYLELEYSGYIPDSYISDQLEKMEIYKGIAAISSDEELDRLTAVLEDRFGPLPDEVESLLSLAEIRIICRKLFISSLKERKGIIEIEFAKVSIISADRIIRLMQEGKVQLDSSRPNILKMETGVIGLKEKSVFIRERLTRLI